MYYLYHIPGKKIGVTRDLNTRVTLIQGYNPSEYEVLDQSDDIDYISDKEIELQKSYGYKVDRKKYKNLFKKMTINVTEQTSTFAIPLNKLKGHLMDNMGMSWETSHGTFQLDMQTIKWITDNAKMSMYNDKRSYIYNKAFAEYFKEVRANIKCSKKPLKMFENIRDWARTRGLYDKGDTMTQYVKLQEEAGELAKALLKDDQPEVVDAIGDMVVVLTNLAHQRGVHIETCIAEAYKVISKRTGKMINGTFVKDEN
jgi:NTP pyrophosphatase (non-canonical NTP hydrolase)